MNSIRYGRRELAPAKIICVGMNYVEHIAELGNDIPAELVIFSKPNSAIETTLRAYHGGEQLHYEVEICYLVENRRLVAVACGLDLTKRDLQTSLRQKGLPWERCKGFDGSALFSEFVPLPSREELLTVELRVDGQVRQQGSTAMMLHQPQAILKEILSFMSLQDGDIVMTGTPSGVGPVRPAEQFSARIMAGGEQLVGANWLAVPGN